MTLPNRTRCFVVVAIMMLAVTAPSFAQISAHGYISDCDQTKAASDYANDPANRGLVERMEELVGQGTVPAVSKSTHRSSLAKYCIAEFLLEKHAYQASVNAYRDSLAGDGIPLGPKSGATSKSGRSSTLLDSANGRSRNTSWQFRPAITLTGRSIGPANCWSTRLNGPELNERARNGLTAENDLQGTHSGCIVGYHPVQVSWFTRRRIQHKQLLVRNLPR